MVDVPSPPSAPPLLPPPLLPLPPFYLSPPFSLCLRPISIMEKHKRSKKASRTVRRDPPLQLDFVRVDGRYRVGKLLGSGGSGKTQLWLSLTFF
jgi:hypothetical protein